MGNCWRVEDEGEKDWILKKIKDNNNLKIIWLRNGVWDLEESFYKIEYKWFIDSYKCLIFNILIFYIYIKIRFRDRIEDKGYIVRGDILKIMCKYSDNMNIIGNKEFRYMKIL